MASLSETLGVEFIPPKIISLGVSHFSPTYNLKKKMVIFKIWFIWPDFHAYDCLILMSSGRACFSQDKAPKLQWMLSTHQIRGLALAFQIWTSAILRVPRGDASFPFAPGVASICFSRWFDLISPRFLWEGNSFPWSKKKNPKKSTSLQCTDTFPQC